MQLAGPGTCYSDRQKWVPHFQSELSQLACPTSLLHDLLGIRA